MDHPPSTPNERDAMPTLDWPTFDWDNTKWDNTEPGSLDWENVYWETFGWEDQHMLTAMSQNEGDFHTATTSADPAETPNDTTNHILEDDTSTAANGSVLAPMTVEEALRCPACPQAFGQAFTPYPPNAQGFLNSVADLWTEEDIIEFSVTPAPADDMQIDNAEVPPLPTLEEEIELPALPTAFNEWSTLLPDADDFLLSVAAIQEPDESAEDTATHWPVHYEPIAEVATPSTTDMDPHRSPLQPPNEASSPTILSDSSDSNHTNSTSPANHPLGLQSCSDLTFTFTPTPSTPQHRTSPPPTPLRPSHPRQPSGSPTPPLSYQERVHREHLPSDWNLTNIHNWSARQARAEGLKLEIVVGREIGRKSVGSRKRKRAAQEEEEKDDVQAASKLLPALKSANKRKKKNDKVARVHWWEG